MGHRPRAQLYHTAAYTHAVTAIPREPNRDADGGGGGGGGGGALLALFRGEAIRRQTDNAGCPDILNEIN